jgi:hypothetical protein
MIPNAILSNNETIFCVVSACLKARTKTSTHHAGRGFDRPYSGHSCVGDIRCNTAAALKEL